MHSREIRRGFLDYFARQGHRIVPSSSLVPDNDPTLLFTNAGMNQFKDVFLGRARRDYTRAASVQKCMRVSGKHNDLDNVGPSLRHHTFFEMLGNFSFGDYFKAEAIAYAWELLTTIWGLSPDRLYPTIFAGDAGVPRDDEAYRLWRRYVPAERIAEFGMADNFWAMGETGPCGRCSEIHYYRGDHVPCPEPVCRGLACDCDRFVEVWNNVFMEFDRQPDGSLVPLPALSVDTGMGLERVTAVIQDKLSNYDTDLFVPILRAIEARTGATYGASAEGDVSMRVIADHLRATTFLVGDGVVPSNEWRGYVLRKIMRRAMRHGRKLGIDEPFLCDLVDVLVAELGEAYPELRRTRDAVVRVVRSEEERFESVLTTGLPRLEEVLDQAARSGGVVPGEAAFRLYDSYGVPLDFIEDLAEQRHLRVDREAFDRAMGRQRARARAASAFKSEGGRVEWRASEATARQLDAQGDVFEGYERTEVSGAVVLALFDAGGAELEQLAAGQDGYAVLDRTPFYIEAGGQVSDTGEIHTPRGSADVRSLVRVGHWPRLHAVHVRSGVLERGSIVTAVVDRERRDATRRNHTATHLLHAALRHVLGPHVRQAGSLVAPDRLRFDFVHFAPLTPDEIDRIERLVNEQIVRNTPVVTDVKATDEAIAAGAMALFGEKYGDRVRVVSVPDFSMELCGGTHCRATGEIGCFVVTAESGVAAGVRRIEAVTGAGAIEHIQARRRRLEHLLEAIGATDEQAVDAAARLHSEMKRLVRENEQLKLTLALGGGSATGLEDAREVSGVRLVTRRVAGFGPGPLRGLADSLRERLKSGVVILASETDGKVALVVSVSKDLTNRLHAGRIVKAIAPIVGGGGGGRADFAEAGGRNPARIDELLSKSLEVVRGMLDV